MKLVDTPRIWGRFVVVMRFAPGVITILAFGLMTSVGRAAVPAAAAQVAEVRLRHGDDPRWAAGDWDDRDWERSAPEAVPLQTGPFWMRWRFTVPAASGVSGPGGPDRHTWPRDQLGGSVDCVAFTSGFPYECFWDGRLLARSGVVGRDRATEVPGPLDHLIRIPDDLLAPGEHVMALRLSSHRFAPPAGAAWVPPVLDRYASRLVHEARQPFLPLVCLSGSLFLAAVCLVILRFAERRRPLVLSTALCVALAAYYALVSARGVYNLPYEWHRVGIEASTVMMAVIGGMVPWLLAEQFAVPHRRWWLSGLLLVLVVECLVAPLGETRGLWISRTMLLASLGLAGWAAWRQRVGAWLVVIGVLVRLVVVSPGDSVFADKTFLVIVSGLVLFICGTLAARGRADRERARETALTAARLEVELLKKNIQPHFLMNTLTTIMEVIEQEPNTAVTLIEALAGEFRILGRVSGEKLISLGQELELCRAHLRIMSIRRGLKCSLATTGIDESATVPPALFHTLVEGGLTHQRARNGELRFTLEGARSEGLVRYTLIAHGESPPLREPAPDTGTGLRYVKARLEESFAGRWSLTVGPVTEGWCTRIEIRPLPCMTGVI